MIQPDSLYLPSLARYRAYVASCLDGSAIPGAGATPNRGLIRGAWGEQILTVPIEGGRRKLLHTPFRYLRLSEHGNWRHTHFHAITSAYGAYPYFPYFADELGAIYAQRHETLAALTSRMHILFLLQSALAENLRYLAARPEERPEARHTDIPEDVSALELLFSYGPESIFYLL